MKADYIFDISELCDQFCYTKICCPFLLMCTLCDGDSNRHKSKYGIASCAVYQTDVYITNIRCEIVSLCKRSNEYAATIIIKDILDLSPCIDLMDSLSKYASYFLIKDEYNTYNGIPMFIYEHTKVDVQYGTSIDSFTKKMFMKFGEIITSSGTQRRYFDFALPTSPSDIKKHEMYIKAMSINDKIGKYIRLYNFFDVICRSEVYRKYAIHYRQNLSSKDEIEKRKFPLSMLATLNEAGIIKVRQLDGTFEPITEEMLSSIRVIRDCVAHSGKNDSEVHRILYFHLVPIVQQIVENDNFVF